MAVQYSLSYDADGNPSLVKNTVEGKAPVIKTDFNIGEYKPTRTVSTDYTFTSTSEDPFNQESQLQILKTYIAENDSDPTTFATSDARKRDTLSAMDKDKMSRIEKFIGKEAATNFEKYAKRSTAARDIKQFTGAVGLFTSNPLNTIVNIGARAVGNYSDRQIDKIMNNMYSSENYQNYMRQLDYEYEAYRDYDVYNDFQGGPNYRDEKGYLDIRPGTYFDAEDEETYSTPTKSTSVSDYTPTMQDPDPAGGGGGNITGSVSRGGTDDTPGTPF